MQCQVFESRLNQLLDRCARPETDARLVSHAQVCEACRELLVVQELLFDGVELLETPAVSPGFAERVLASLEPGRRPYTFFSPRWLGLAAAVAAMLLVTFVSGQAWLSRPGVKTALPGTAKSRPSSVGGASSGAGALAITIPNGVKPTTPSLKPAVSGDPQPVGASGELANEDYRRLLASWADRVPRDGFESVEQIPGGLRPIATSFNVAIGLLRRTLPGGKDEPVSPPKPQAAFPPIEWPEHVI